MRISAVIPTRGDVAMGPIIDRLQEYPEIEEVVIVMGDTPFNRYLAAERAKNDVILTQDDDCLTDFRPLIDAFEPGVIVNAMTPEHAAHYPGRQTLIGFGAIFDRSLIRCFDGWQRDDLFLRESDRVFGTLNPHKTVFPSIQIAPHASAANRLWKQPNHCACRDAMNARIFEKAGIRA